MGKSSRAGKKAHRKAEKAKRKAANRAKYEAYRDSGNNSKKKSNRRAGAQVVRSRTHPVDCGNVGCKKCHPGWWNKGDPRHPFYKAKKLP